MGRMFWWGGGMRGAEKPVFFLPRGIQQICKYKSCVCSEKTQNLQCHLDTVQIKSGEKIET
jgi:hypothetical protein